MKQCWRIEWCSYVSLIAADGLVIVKNVWLTTLTVTYLRHSWHWSSLILTTDHWSHMRLGGTLHIMHNKVSQIWLFLETLSRQHQEILLMEMVMKREMMMGDGNGCRKMSTRNSVSRDLWQNLSNDISEYLNLTRHFIKLTERVLKGS